MGFLGKTLASLGIGAATVDARLEKSTYRQGEEVKGEIYIHGGETEQQIDEIYIYLIFKYYQQGEQMEYVVDEHRIAEPFAISAHEARITPFAFHLALDTPVTASGSPIFIKTGLNIKRAIDPKDTDGMEMLPHPYVDILLQGIERIGFQLIQVELDFEHFYSRHPFIQVYRFEPVHRFQEELDQCSFIFHPSAHGVDCIIQLDRKPTDLVSSMAEALSLDVRLNRFTITADELNQDSEEVQDFLYKRIQQELE